MKKQPEITDKTRQVLVATFCELYTEMPIEKISIRSITDQSGYNRATFYRYFCDIYQLLEYVENDVLQYVRDEFSQNNSSKRSVVENVVKLFDVKGSYLNALLGDYGSIHFLERIKNEMHFEKGRWHTADDDPHAPYLNEFHISTVFSMLRLWQRRKCDLPLEELFNLINKLYTGAMTAVLGKYDPTK